MRFIQQKNREQYFLPTSIDDYISNDNSIRFIDAFIDHVIESNSKDYQWKGLNDTGRTSYSPSTMHKLLIYGYLNGIQGSRKLENETYRNLELIWLTGDLHPDHWTICSFRRENDKQIKSLKNELVKFLKSFDYVTGKLVATDGSKFKAYASKNVLSVKKLDKQISKIRQTIDEYLKAFETKDNAEDVQSEYDEYEAEINKALLEKISELHEKLEELESKKGLVKESGKKKLSEVDKDANFMRDKGKIILGYNGQISTDGTNHFIIQSDVTNEANDLHQLENNYHQITEETEIEPDELLVDKGYFNLDMIYSITTSTSSKIYAPWLQNNYKTQDKKNKIDFTYDSTADLYICSEGKRLEFQQEKQKRNQLYRIYRGVECEGCAKRSKCTKSKYGRYLHKIKLSEAEHQWRESYKKKMEHYTGKERNKKRKTIVEHCFGTIKMLLGTNHFILRGLEKVRIEFDLYTLAYNLKRLSNVAPISELLAQLREYKMQTA